MDRTILRTLFLDNLEIPAEIARFCDAVPGYAQAERGYDRAAQELMELIGMCDRIIVLSRGRVTGNIKREDFSQERIMRAATGLETYGI